MKPIEKELDRAFQKLSVGKRCFNCKKSASEIHHREKRENKVYRWNKENALPICRKCHNGIHFEGLKFPKLEIERIGLKDYLLREGLIFDEFLTLANTLTANA